MKNEKKKTMLWHSLQWICFLFLKKQLFFKRIILLVGPIDIWLEIENLFEFNAFRRSSR